MTDIRTKIADLIPLSLLDGRDERKDVFEVADQIITMLRREGVMLPRPTKQVTYKHGGPAVWTAEEYSPGWWRIVEWQSSTRPGMSEEELRKNFTEVEEIS